MNALSENFIPAFLEARRRKVLNEYTENKKIFCLEESRDSSRKSIKYSLHNNYDVRSFHEIYKRLPECRVSNETAKADVRFVKRTKDDSHQSRRQPLTSHSDRKPATSQQFSRHLTRSLSSTSRLPAIKENHRTSVGSLREGSHRRSYSTPALSQIYPNDKRDAAVKEWFSMANEKEKEMAINLLSAVAKLNLGKKVPERSSSVNFQKPLTKNSSKETSQSERGLKGCASRSESWEGNEGVQMETRRNSGKRNNISTSPKDRKSRNSSRSFEQSNSHLQAATMMEPTFGMQQELLGSFPVNPGAITFKANQPLANEFVIHPEWSTRDQQFVQRYFGKIEKPIVTENKDEPSYGYWRKP